MKYTVSHRQKAFNELNNYIYFKKYYSGSWHSPAEARVECNREKVLEGNIVIYSSWFVLHCEQVDWVVRTCSTLYWTEIHAQGLVMAPKWKRSVSNLFLMSYCRYIMGLLELRSGNLRTNKMHGISWLDGDLWWMNLIPVGSQTVREIYRYKNK
jgi:hypothetical protein